MCFCEHSLLRIVQTYISDFHCSEKRRSWLAKKFHTHLFSRMDTKYGKSHPLPTFNKSGLAQSGTPLTFQKTQFPKNAKDAILKLLKISQCRKIRQGVQIRLGNHFFPNRKTKNVFFSFLKSLTVPKGAFSWQNYFFPCRNQL